MTTGKTIALSIQTFFSREMSLLFNMLSRFIIAFLLRSKCLKKIKSDTVSVVSPLICYEMMGVDVMILVLWMLSFNPTFSLSTFTFIKRLCSSSLLSAIRVLSSAYLRLLKQPKPMHNHEAKWIKAKFHIIRQSLNCLKESSCRGVVNSNLGSEIVTLFRWLNLESCSFIYKIKE